jgi:hypothetical protein
VEPDSFLFVHSVDKQVQPTHGHATLTRQMFRKYQMGKKSRNKVVTDEGAAGMTTIIPRPEA